MSTGQDTAIGNGTVVTDRGVQAEVLTADGVHLRYIDQGAGRPVVFVHGWLSCAEHWRPVAAPIAGMARAVTYVSGATARPTAPSTAGRCTGSPAISTSFWRRWPSPAPCWSGTPWDAQ